MVQSAKPFVPAAGRNWRLPFYDILTKLLGADAIRRELVARAAPGAGQRVLDVGTGTGSLAIACKRARRDAEVVGIDPDPRALAIARRKAGRARVAIRFEQGYADALPYPDGSFDRVVSSFVLHHLETEDVLRALREMRRVLAPGGRLHIVDFDGGPVRHRGLLARHVHHGWKLQDAVPRTLALLESAGLRGARVVGRKETALGGVSYYEALVDAPAPAADVAARSAR